MLSPLPRNIRRPLVLALGGLLFGALAFGNMGSSAPSPTFAEDLTPPAPPSYIPPTIGPPPGPPITSSPTPVPTATPTATATATPAPGGSLSFSLDAVRVSRVNNPGNLSGLVAVRPGSKVWLMMYYTVKSVPKNTQRVTTYSIQFKGRTIFKVAYKGSLKRTDTGRFSRYAVYSVPRTLPFGSYTYQGALTVGKKVKTKSWKFSIAKQERSAKTG